ncbi:MAG: class II fructose-bisphosphate aldolase family protein [Desulfosarcinaceae bacterium]|nr:class II fructose-bisphosphate aldolase family protein [Desulfosarcinaceae bacterium]
MNPCNLTQLGVTRESPWAVGHFNIHNLEYVRAVVRAAAAERSPAILAVGMLSIKYMGLAPLIQACQTISRETEVPVAVHLDHARQLGVVREALDLGINSVMFDGSALSYAENVEKTTEVVKMAHDLGATAEGEVGIVPHGAAQVSAEDMTDPARAVEFAERTGVDFLAVSLGSVHGMKRAGTSLNQALLQEVHQQIPVPLVLHGASGVIDSQIQAAVANGIRKINVNTGLKVVLKRHLTAHLASRPESDLLDDFEGGMAAVAQSVAQRMRLFGSSGKA